MASKNAAADEFVSIASAKHFQSEVQPFYHHLCVSVNAEKRKGYFLQLTEFLMPICKMSECS